LPADGDVKIESPKQPQFTSPFSLDQFIGIILIIFGIWFISKKIGDKVKTELKEK